MATSFCNNRDRDGFGREEESSRCCFQAFFDTNGHSMTNMCDCYQTCYTCDHTCYGYTSSSSGANTEYRPCSCNATCYSEELVCSCNASANMSVRDTCVCDNTCYGYGECNIDGCDSYAPCICDGSSDRYECAQCDLTRYDLNSPTYYCPCDSTCDGYVKPKCNCDGAYEKPLIVRCGANTIEDQCGVYTNNIDWNYVTKRYY